MAASAKERRQSYTSALLIQPKPKTFDVKFEAGSLGIKLQERNGHIMVSGSAGQALTGGVQVADELAAIKIDDIWEDVGRTKPARDTIKLIAAQPRPVQLRFRRAKIRKWEH